MVAVTDMVDLTIDHGIAVVSINNPPVNALSHGVRLGIFKGVETALADQSVDAIVVHCVGPHLSPVQISVNLAVHQKSLTCPLC